jgi:hypothetical protein
MFRSTGDLIKWMRGKRQAAPLIQEPATTANRELPEINVSADFSRRVIRVDVGGVCDFTLDQKTAVALAKQIDGAADALGPESSKADEVAIDLTEDAEEEAKDG